MSKTLQGNQTDGGKDSDNPRDHVNREEIDDGEVVRLGVTVAKYPNRQLSGEDFWFTVSETSARGCLDRCAPADHYDNGSMCAQNFLTSL